MKISIIIPTHNESKNINYLINNLLANRHNLVAEIIVVDAQSTDNTLEIAQQAGAIAVCSPQKGRAAQMNWGVKHATSDILYFVHADTKVPESYETDIQKALNEGYKLGCYRYQFDSSKFILKINAYFTRFNFLFCRGGDQTLFITKDLFEQMGGFDERFVIMEDYDILLRAKQVARFKIMPKNAYVSARKYETNSWLRVQFANLTAMMMFNFRIAPERIARTYKKMLN